MNKMTKTLALLIPVLLAIGGLYVLQSQNLMQGDTESVETNVEPYGGVGNETRCEKILKMDEDDYRFRNSLKLPSRCFYENGEPVVGKISGAEPGDHFRNNNGSIEIVEK